MSRKRATKAFLANTRTLGSMLGSSVAGGVGFVLRLRGRYRHKNVSLQLPSLFSQSSKQTPARCSFWQGVADVKILVFGCQKSNLTSVLFAPVLFRS
jgi:hypothetical protein